MCAAMDPAASLSTYSPHPERTRAMDDGEAYEGNDTELGKTRQWLPTRRRVRGLTGSATVARK